MTGTETFSPHTRGCSFHLFTTIRKAPVFPAYAGMFRYRKRKKIFEGRFPRIRGDVPWALAPGQNSSWFSPHTRGCSWWLRCARPLGCVFPAYAGMFLSVRVMRRVSSGFPRIRGDVPDMGVAPGGVTVFSPHTRGCSPWPNTPPGRDPVFPAYAGMFRDPIYGDPLQLCFPRIRGDVPLSAAEVIDSGGFSPHTRGCSSANLSFITGMEVFPAYAGMFRPVTPHD